MAADLYEPDVGTAFYRTRDPIKNFKVKIRLERLSSASFGVPQVNRVGSDENDVNVRMENMRKQQTETNKDVEEYVFKWQEKVLSRREVATYKDPTNCNTVLEQKYHEDSKLLDEIGRPTNRLFTYVDNDAYATSDEVLKMTTSPNEEPSQLAAQMGGVRRRKAAPANKNTFVPKMSVVNYEPTPEESKKNRLRTVPTQTMYIMVDTSNFEGDPTPDKERIICTIKVDTNGVLSVRPDFSKGNKPYKLAAEKTGAGAFNYTVEHVSKGLSRTEQDRERKMFKELYNRHAEFLASCVGQEFEMPPIDVMRMLVYGEILCARNFESDNLYIQYFIELPDGWSPNGMQQLSGVTQVCKCKTENRDEVAYFSFPFNFELCYKHDFLSKTKVDMPKWPVMYFEVLSLDSWQRYRTEGYGYTQLPCCPGSTEQKVHCWRPKGRSWFADLRRYFIGGTPELEDPTYVASASTFEGSHLSKFGFRTVSTGTVDIRFNLIQQSQAFLRTTASKKKVTNLMDRIGHSKAQANIMNVIEAFQRAKQRMINAREHLKTEYAETLKAYAADEDD